VNEIQKLINYFVRMVATYNSPCVQAFSAAVTPMIMAAVMLPNACVWQYRIRQVAFTGKDGRTFRMRFRHRIGIQVFDAETMEVLLVVGNLREAMEAYHGGLYRAIYG